MIAHFRNFRKFFAEKTRFADEDGILYTCYYVLLGTKEMFYGGDGLWDMQKPLGGI